MEIAVRINNNLVNYSAIICQHKKQKIYTQRKPYCAYSFTL